MDSIIAKLLHLDQESDDSLRKILEQNGLRQVSHSDSHNYSLTFDDGKVFPDQLVVIGYDKDLDLNFTGWLTSYQQKEADESMSIYAMPIDDVTKILGPRCAEVKTSAGLIEVPTSNAPLSFTSLPFERKDFPLAISIEKTVTLPTELLCHMYIPAGTNLMSILAAFCTVYGFTSKTPLNDSTCTGRVTMPLVLFTGRGIAGTEYAMAVGDLDAVVAAQRDYIKNNFSNNFLRKSTLHAKMFVNKYKKILNK